MVNQRKLLKELRQFIFREDLEYRQSDEFTPVVGISKQEFINHLDTDSKYRIRMRDGFLRRDLIANDIEYGIKNSYIEQKEHEKFLGEKGSVKTFIKLTRNGDKIIDSWWYWSNQVIGEFGHWGSIIMALIGGGILLFVLQHIPDIYTYFYCLFMQKCG
jgi:hypothetical protein